MKPEERVWRLLDLLMGLIVTVALALSGWALKSVVDLRVEVVNLTANRFTAQDGLLVWQEIGSIREKLAGTPVNIPPEWFIDRVDRLEKKIEDMAAAISRLESRN